MTTIAPPIAAEVRPMLSGEEKYIFSTARRIAAQVNGGHLVYWPTLCDLVDHVLVTSDVKVAAYPQDPDQIVGWAAWGQDGVCEWLYLRRSFDEAPRASIPVIHALLNWEPAVTFRRCPTMRLLDRLGEAGVTVKIVLGCV